MFRLIRRSKVTKIACIIMAIILLESTLGVTRLMALTSGSTQPEVQGFEPFETNQMVDLFTGDFTYNIPLFELDGPAGGYPFNLAYHSGVSMEQEASWVGLGWTLNPGSLNRGLRGFPDDFNGDNVETQFDMRTDCTLGIGAGGLYRELFGFPTSPYNASYTVTYNTFKGWSSEFSFNSCIKAGPVGIGLGLSMSSDNGSFVNASASKSGGSISIGYGSQTGSSVGASVGMVIGSKSALTSMKEAMAEDKAEPSKVNPSKPGAAMPAGLSYNFHAADQMFNPISTQKFISSHFDFTLRIGAGAGGTFNAGYINGTYSESKPDNSTMQIPTYGYLYLEGADNRGTYKNLDFSRYGDGAIGPNNTNLPSPTLTNDSYSLCAQGFSGRFRSYKNTLGTVYSPPLENVGTMYQLNADVGFLIGHYGLDLGYGETHSSTGPGSKFAKDFFKQPDGTNSYQEPFYFKMDGELTSYSTNEINSIGNYEAIDGTEIVVGNQNFFPHSDRGVCKSSDGYNRVPRSKMIEYYTKSKVDEFGIEKAMFQAQNANTSSLQNHHIICYSVVNTDGKRYTYSMPVLNTSKAEYIYSCGNSTPYKDGDETYTSGLVNASDQDYNKYDNEQLKKYTKTPAYVDHYLLTSITGPDYVDSDRSGAPSDGDKGYWVKFSYSNPQDYTWVYPYPENGKNAGFSPGFNYTKMDDKAFYTTGKRQNVYLTTAETKTQKAEFICLTRRDGKGVANSVSSQLDMIKVYAKNTSDQLLKTIHFDYEYTLCTQTPNSDDTQKGKLTLKSMWTEFEGGIGDETKYIFGYQNSNSDLVKAHNPSFNRIKNDRWGCYKPDNMLSGGEELNYFDHPYTKQPHQGFDPNYATNSVDAASAWLLSSIALPGGSKINIKYESDQYGYVQNKQATQMFYLAGIGEVGKNTIFDSNWNRNNPNATTENSSKLFFRLDKKYSYDAETFRKYFLEDLGRLQGDQTVYQLYFKIKQTLKKDVNEYVEGYADLDMSNNSYGVITHTDGNMYGFVTVKKIKIDTQMPNGIYYYHPFAAAGWQFMRINTPYLFGDPGSNMQDAMNGDSDGRMSFIRSQLNMLESITELFKDFTGMAFRSQWANQLILSNSCIKLCTPDKSKYGGGTRVQSISLSNPFNNEATSETGQKFDYTTTDKDGRTISSGVASYEPILGGNENALHWARTYTSHVRTKSALNLFFEYPLNEDYYPTPMVGYEKVTVTPIQKNNLEEAFQGNGITEYEYYTAKEFPVLTSETNLIPGGEPHTIIPIPIVGQIESYKYTATQGYSIVLNDMHGRLKSVASYAQDISGGKSGNPINKISYHYKEKVVTNTSTNKSRMLLANGLEAKELDNKCKVLLEDVPKNYNFENGDFSSTTEDRILGEEYELFFDTRKDYSSQTRGALQSNVDLFGVTPFIIPIFVFIPDFNRSTNELETAVTNKIITRTGILDYVQVDDEKTSTITSNELFDKLTGDVLLTKTTSKYAEKPIYSYNFPAYHQYSIMGPRYVDWGNTYAGYLNSNSQYLNMLDQSAGNITALKSPLDKHVGSCSHTNTTVTITSCGDDQFLSDLAELLTNNLSDGKFILSTSFTWSDDTYHGSFFNIDQKKYQCLGRIYSQLFISDDCINRSYKGGTVGDYQTNPTNAYYYHIWLVSKAKYAALLGEHSDLPSSFRSLALPKSTDAETDIYHVCNIGGLQKINGTNVKIKSFKVVGNKIFALYDNNQYINQNQIYNGDSYTTHYDDLHAPNGAPTEYKDYQTKNYSHYYYGPLDVLAANTQEYTTFGNVMRPSSTSYYEAPRLSKAASRDLSTEGVFTSKDDVDNKHYFYQYNWNPIIPLIQPTNWVERSTVAEYDALTGNPSKVYDNRNNVYCNKYDEYGRLTMKTFATTPDKVFTETFDNNGTLAHNGAGLSTGYMSSHCMGQNFPIGTYLLSFWIHKEQAATADVSVWNDGERISPKLEIADDLNNTSDWVRASTQIKITETHNSIDFSRQSGGAYSILIDDLRLQPINSKVTEYFYDLKHRLTRIMDENNYGTHFYYDLKGNLQQVQKETWQGIQTINESRSHLIKAQ